MIYTQCPHCQTAFRVTDVQLRAALGTVRCGPCGHIFSATERKISEPQAGQSKPPISPSTKPTSPTDDEAKATGTGSLFPDQLSDIDVVGDDAFSESFKSMSLGEATAEGFTPEAFQDEENYNTVSEDDWVLALLEADSKAATDNTTKTAETPRPKVDDESTTNTENDGESPVDEVVDFYGHDDDFHIPDLGLDSSDINDTTATNTKDSSKLFGFLWPLLTLVAVVALVAQLGFFYFDQLAIDDRLRPAYKIICAQLDCELPPQVDVSNITSTGLTIRPHPTLKNALTVDLILINNATFSQSFPKVQLDFSNLEQQLVATRLFTPEEYLNADFTPLDKMPIAVPIHLSFEIKHPGDEATNFSVKVVQ